MKLRYSILAFLFTNEAIACSAILGTWESSKEMSMKYNIEHAQLTPSQSELLEQILGVKKYTYTESFIHEHGSDTLKISVNNQQYDFVVEDLVYEYKIISCGKDSLVIKSQLPDSGSSKTKINFVDENTIWIAPTVFPNSREYFVRIP